MLVMNLKEVGVRVVGRSEGVRVGVEDAGFAVGDAVCGARVGAPDGRNVQPEHVTGQSS